MKKLVYLLWRLLGVKSLQAQITQQGKTSIALEEEILCALKFNSTIVDSNWFKYRGISPGGSAVDYAFFYTLYRVLSSVKPSRILEFGLGQSSKMVHQYADFFHAEAVTVEHDPSWADFFMSSREGDYPVQIKIMDLAEELYKGTKVLTYKDCAKSFAGCQFDLILVDGPFGFSPDTVFSRPQIIELSRQCLSSDFVIIIDDYERLGEQNTAKEILDYFDSEGIQYVTRVYGSVKNHLLITVPKLKFLTTL